MRSVRLNFSKTGRAIYISHLDVNRMMTRAVRRAKLPMWYTEGFNPHPYISFALPLPLGQSSDCEYMDIRVEGDISDEEIMEKMNSALPDGIKINSVAAPVHDLHEIQKAQYMMKAVFENEQDAKTFADESKKLLNGAELIAEKRGKKGHRKIMKQINLIDFIFDSKLSQNDNTVSAHVTLAAGNTNNLNPFLLMDTLENCVGIHHAQLYVVRENLITANNEIFR
jgi:radical SAM-linked protein